MTMNKDSWGTLTFNKIEAMGITAGTPITDDQLSEVWKRVAESNKEHISANADIDLQAGDIPVPATGIKDSLNAPCTGAAATGAKNLTTRIK